MKTNKVTRFLNALTEEQKKLRQEILSLTHTAKVSHLGSCLSAVDIISAIYYIKKEKDIFVLSSGHAAVALYAVLNLKRKSKKMNLSQLHIHPDRNRKLGISVSTGSLGQGLPIAVGMALADRKKRVYCLVSDGECSEGSIWEALRISQEQKLSNLSILINMNGYGAYGKIHMPLLTKRLKAFIKDTGIVNGHNSSELKKELRKKIANNPHIIIAKTNVEQFPFLIGQDAHYKIMSDADFDSANRLLQ